MKKIFGLLMVLSMIIFSYGCANESAKKDTKQQVVEVFKSNPNSQQGIGGEGATGKGGATKQLEEMSGKHLPVAKVQSSDGTLVYKIDSVFTIESTSKVEARIIKEVGQSTTNMLISLTHKTRAGVIKTQIIKVGDIMDMNLVSLDPDAFVINKVSSGDQVVSKTAVTEWIWGVTPKKTGQYDLILKATIRENNVGNDKIVFDKLISVVNKPKRNWSYELKVPNNLIDNSPNVVSITITQQDSVGKNTFKWGGFGEVQLEFDNELSYNIVVSDTDNIIDSKSFFINKWIVTPDTKLKVKSDTLQIKIIGNYEQYIICRKGFTIKPNFKYKLSNFINGAAKSWYWIFTTLLIPLYHILKKKYFPHKRIFSGKTRKPRVKKTN